MENKQSMWWKIFRVFGITMLLLTFFSKTLYHLSLPVVELATVSDDSLKIEWFSTAEVESMNSERVRAAVSGSVESILVKVGDHVKEGDILLVIDDTPVREELAALELSRKAVSTQLGLVNDQKGQLENDDQSEALETAKALYESGVIAKAEYQARLTAVTARKQAANGLLQSVAQYSSELAAIDRQVELLKEKVTACTIRADKNMQVQSIVATEGDYVSIHQEVLVLQNTTAGFSVAIEMETKYASFLSPGDKAQVKRFSAFESKDCVLVSKEPVVGRSDVEVLTFEIREGMYSIGEKLNLSLVKHIGSGALIPKAALKPSATDRQALYVVTEVDGIFGKRNVVKEMLVTVTHTGTSNVLVDEPVMSGTKVVSYSSRALKAGDIVYVEDK